MADVSRAPVPSAGGALLVVELLEHRYDVDHTNTGGGVEADCDAATIGWLRDYEELHGVRLVVFSPS